MDYEKAYKEALKRAKTIITLTSSYEEVGAATTIFPELGEFEDERIRKELLEHCINRRDGKQICVDANDYRRWAAWLEKQGEKSWSEEDEKRISRIADFIWKNRKGDTDEIYQQEQDADWLKSLKPNHWKPSEEQMEALTIAVHDSHEYCYYKNLYSLYNDLKSL